MSSNICGPQYTGRGCECRPQVTPGITPGTGEASNPTWICAHVQDGVQIPCDPGCCPTDCSTKDGKSTGIGSAMTSKSTWWIILVSILFGLMLFVSYFYNATKRNTGGRLPIGIAVFTVATLVAVIVTTAVMLTKK